MPYITAVVGLLNADGSNPVPAKADGTREAPVIVLGDGLSFSGDIRGRVTLTATSSFSGVINDTQHGSRGGGSLHALAVAGGAAGFLSGTYAENLQYYTGQVAPLVTGTFGVDVTGGGILWWQDAVAGGRDAENQYAGRRWTSRTVFAGTWNASDGEFIQADGGVAGTITLPAGGGEIQAVLITNVGAGAQPVATTGGSTIQGLASPQNLASAAAWLLVGPNTNNDWVRFVAA